MLPAAVSLSSKGTHLGSSAQGHPCPELRGQQFPAAPTVPAPVPAVGEVDAEQVQHLHVPVPVAQLCPTTITGINATTQSSGITIINPPPSGHVRDKLREGEKCLEFINQLVPKNQTLHFCVG